MSQFVHSMKSFIIVVVLTTIAIGNDAASIPKEVATLTKEVVEFPENAEDYIQDYNIDEASGVQLQRNDDFILFYEEFINLDAIPDTVQIRDVVYRGNSTTYIRRTTISNPFTFGHLYINMNVTYAHVRITSMPGVGINSWVRFFGLYND